MSGVYSLRCPKCGGDTQVVDSREGPFGCWRRKRRCVLCKYRFGTTEAYAAPKGKHRTYPEKRILSEPQSAAALYRERWEREHGEQL